MTSKSKAFLHWLTVYHLMPAHWVNWDQTDTFVAKKMPRLGGPKMWDHVNRPPVGLSLLFQYHSCQGPCTRWHSLSPREKMFQFRLSEKKTKHKTQGLWQVSALTNPEKRGLPKCSFNCGMSIKVSKWGRLGGTLTHQTDTSNTHHLYSRLLKKERSKFLQMKRVGSLHLYLHSPTPSFLLH